MYALMKFPRKLRGSSGLRHPFCCQGRQARDARATMCSTAELQQERAVQCHYLACLHLPSSAARPCPVPGSHLSLHSLRRPSRSTGTTVASRYSLTGTLPPGAASALGSAAGTPPAASSASVAATALEGGSSGTAASTSAGVSNVKSAAAGASLAGTSGSASKAGTASGPSVLAAPSELLPSGPVAPPVLQLFYVVSCAGSHVKLAERRWVPKLFIDRSAPRVIVPVDSGSAGASSLRWIGAGSPTSANGSSTAPPASAPAGWSTRR